MENSIRKNKLSLLAYIIIFFTPLEKLLSALDLSPLIRVVILDFGVYLIMAIAVTLILKGNFKEDYVKFKALGLLKKIVLITCLGFIMIMLTNNLGLYIRDLFSGGVTSNNQMMVESTLSLERVKVFTMISIVFLGPYVEEVVFRKKNIFEIGKYYKMNTILVLIISALLFGLVHVIFTFDFISLPLYFLGGIVYGLTYMKSNNILVPIMVHVVVNSLVFFTIVFTQVYIMLRTSRELLSIHSSKIAFKRGLIL